MDIIVQYLLWSIETIAFIIIAGYLIGFLTRIIQWILTLTIGGIFAYFFVNYLTFLGVILHELSHAILAILTGAKVKHIRFFAPNGNSLGSVTMVPRGNFITKSIQEGLSALAPAFCSILWLYLLKKFLYPYTVDNTVILILFAYLCISIILHASLSGADIRVGLKGLPGCFLVIFFILFIGKIYPGDLCLNFFDADPFAFLNGYLFP